MSVATLEHPEAKAHAMATIADGAHQQFTKTPEQAHTMHQHAVDLLDTFGKPAADQNKARCLFTIATSGVGCAEFNDTLKEAEKMAAGADKASGWTVPEGIKGRAKYGPRQSSFVSQASNMRQVFGCLKIEPEAIVRLELVGTALDEEAFPSFAVAYGKAKQHLDKLGCDWQGRKLALVDMQAERKAKRKQEDKAREMAEEANPPNDGETQASYNARIATVLAHFQDKEAQARADEAGAKLWDKLTEKHGEDFAELVLMAALKAGGFNID